MSARSAHRTRRARLAVAFAAAALLVLGTLGYVALQLSTQGLRDEINDRARDSATLSALVVRQQTARLADIARSFAERRSVVEAVERGDVAQLRREMQELRMSTNGLRVAFVTDAEGDLLTLDPFDRTVVGKNFSERDWYRGSMRRSPYVSDAYNTAAFDAPKVYAAASTVQASGKVIGVVIVAQSDHLQGMLDRYRKDRGQTLTVVDQQGVVVAQAGSPSNELRKDNDPGLAKALDGSESVRSRTDADLGGELLSAYAQVEGIGWAVRSDIPASAALNRIANLRRAEIALATIAALLMLALLTLFYRLMRNVDRADRREMRSRQAFEVNDTIVQRLAVADLAFGMGRHEQAAEAVRDALVAGKRIISEWADDAEPDELIRSEPASAKENDV